MEWNLRVGGFLPRAPRLLRYLAATVALLGASAGVASGAVVRDRTLLQSMAGVTRVSHFAHSAPKGNRRPRQGTRSGETKIPAIVQPSATEHLTLLKVGDSLGEELGFGLRDVLGSNRNLTVIQDAVGDTGLARPDYYNWPLQLQHELVTYRPRGVIVMLGGDDGQGFSYQGKTVIFGSASWHTIYSQRVATMMSEATAAGAHVIWVGLPIMRSGLFSSEMAQMNAIYSAQAAIHPGVTFVPTWSLFANSTGNYSAYLPGPSGSLVLMRNPDGVHFSGAGADRLGVAVVHAMNTAWKVHL